MRCRSSPGQHNRHTEYCNIRVITILSTPQRRSIISCHTSIGCMKYSRTWRCDPCVFIMEQLREMSVDSDRGNGLQIPILIRKSREIRYSEQPVLWTTLRSQIRHLPEQDLERIRRAFEVGEEAHKGQKRRSGEPFFTHPVTVALSLIHMGADADTIIAALLHDTVEDTSITLEELKSQFGGTVAHLIDGVTKLDAETPGKHPSPDDQIENIRKIFTLMQDDARIIVIKLMDRLHNMKTTEPLPVEKKINLAKETNDLYVKIADRLSMQDVRDELEGLCLSILEPTLFQTLSLLRSASAKNTTNIMREMESHMRHSQKGFTEHLTLEYDNKTCQKLRNHR